MTSSAVPPAILVDLQVLLDHVGERGLALTDTGRLRIADVRAINARFTEPEELDQRLGDLTFSLRREDDAWRVHLLRLVAQAAGLLDARLGRVRRTARARSFARLAGSEAVRLLFVAWWWKGAWDLISASAPVELRLERDRGAALRGLVDLGTAQRRIGGLGARLRETVAPELGPDVHPALDDEAWGFGAWRVCLKPLSAFDGCVATYAVREINGHPFEELSAARISESGSALLEAAVEASPVVSPRVRRGMRRHPDPSPRARPAARADDDSGDAVAADERHEHILEQHPGYGAAIERGEDLVDGVNPRLHLAMHQAVQEQLGSDDAPEARAAFARLVALGHDEHDVIHALADAFTRELWRASKEHRAFDHERYVARLEALPGSPTGEDEDVQPADLPPARLADRERARLRGLPRSAHVWEGDLSEIPAEIAGLGIPLCALWVDTLDGTIRAMRPDVEADPGALMLAAFVDAARRPKAGRAELPWRVRLHPELAAALRDALGSIQVRVEEAEELPLAHAALDSLAEFLADPAPPPSRPRGRRRR